MLVEKGGCPHIILTSKPSTPFMSNSQYLVLQVMMLFVVMCERAVATFCSQKYETSGVTIGISLTAAGVS